NGPGGWYWRPSPRPWPGGPGPMPRATPNARPWSAWTRRRKTASRSSAKRSACGRASAADAALARTCPRRRSETVEHRALARAGGVERELGLHAARVTRCGGLPGGTAARQFGLAHVELELELVGVDGDGVAF